MLSARKLIWLKPCLLLITFIYSTLPVNAGKSRWQEKMNCVDSYIELGKLKRHCFNMLVKVEQSLKEGQQRKYKKNKNRWKNRLIKLEALAQSTREFTDTPLINEAWPKNFARFTFISLKTLEVQCLRMIGYKNLLLTDGIWAKRLQEVENLLQGPKPINFKSRQKSKSNFIPEESSNAEPYKIRHIYINTNNPGILDLHGVASARIARRKVIEFINAVKSKRKTQALIITGKGNHSSYKKRHGVLFTAFPNWIKDNKNINSYKVGKGNGSYVVSLTQAFPGTLGALQTAPQYVQRKLAHVRPLEQQIAWEKRYGKSDFAYKQMDRELTRILYNARHLQKLEEAYSREEYLTSLMKILCQEEDIIELEEEEVILSSLQKPRFEDFLSKQQKKQLNL